MIRQLKSIKQIEVLLLSDLGLDKELRAISPKVVLTIPANPDECNWDVVEWTGPATRVAKISRDLGSRVADLRRRYKAISPRKH